MSFLNIAGKLSSIIFLYYNFKIIPFYHSITILSLPNYAIHYKCLEEVLKLTSGFLGHIINRMWLTLCHLESIKSDIFSNSLPRELFAQYSQSEEASRAYLYSINYTGKCTHSSCCIPLKIYVVPYQMNSQCYRTLRKKATYVFGTP